MTIVLFITIGSIVSLILAFYWRNRECDHGYL